MVRVYLCLTSASFKPKSDVRFLVSAWTLGLSSVLVHWKLHTHQHEIQDCGVIGSISPREGDGPGANPGFLTSCGKRKCAASVQGDRPIRKRILLNEQSQPRDMDLTPVFGSELFVAQGKHGTAEETGNRKLFTVIHNPQPWRMYGKSNPQITGSLF